jgi:ABC-type transporter Mla subunit MlaD
MKKTSHIVAIVIFIFVILTMLSNAIISSSLDLLKIPLVTAARGAVLILLLLFFFAIMIVLMHQFRMHDGPVTKKLEIIESIFLRAGTPIEALNKISCTIDHLEQNILPKASPSKRKWWGRVNKDDGKEHAQVIQVSLKEFNNSVERLKTNLTVMERDLPGEIEKLYGQCTEILQRLKSLNIPEKDRSVVYQPFYQILVYLDFHYQDYISSIHHDVDLQKTAIEAVKESKASDFFQLNSQLKDLLKSFFSQEDGELVYLKNNLETVEILINRIKVRVSKIADMEHAQVIQIGLELDDLGVDYYRFHRNVVEKVEILRKNPSIGARRQKLWDDFLGGIKKINTIINSSRQNYQKFTAITAGLETLSQQYTLVLESQQKKHDDFEKNLKVMLENQEKNLNQLMGQLQTDATAIKEELTNASTDTIRHIIQTHDEKLDEKKVELGNTIDEVKNKCREVIDDINHEAKRELNDLNDYYEKKNETADKFMNKISTSLAENADSMQIVLSSIAEKQASAMADLNIQTNESLKKSALEMIDGLKDDFSKILSELDNKIDSHTGKLGTAMKEANSQLDDTIENTDNRLKVLTDSLDDQFKIKLDRLNQVIIDSDNRLIHSVKMFDGQVEEKKQLMMQLLEKMNGYAYDLVKNLQEQFTGFVDQREHSFEQSGQQLRDDLMKLESAFNIAMDYLKDKLSTTLELMTENYNINTGNIKTEVLRNVKDSVQNLEKELKIKMGHVENSLDETLTAAANHIQESHRENIERLEEEVVKPLKKGMEMLPNHQDSSVLTPVVEFINKKMFLKLSTTDAPVIINKLDGEPAFSENYRQCAISLHKDLVTLEKSEPGQWYWEYIDTLKQNLVALLRPFYNREGETIYDEIFQNDSSIKGLKDIEPGHLVELINRQHWGQLWGPLLCWSRFFNAYFKTQMKEFCTLLDYHSYAVGRVLEKQLGYHIDSFTPMESITGDYSESVDYEVLQRHIFFHREILKQMGNSEAFSLFRQKDSQEGNSVIYLDQLGLSYNGRRICRTKLLTYSEESVRPILGDIKI